MRSMTLALLVFLFAFPALAQSEAAPAADAPTQPAVAPDAASLPEKSAVSAAEVGTRSARRERFDIHRQVGIATEALMLGALAFYIVDDVQRFGPGERIKSFMYPTLGLASAAEVGMVVNALLALTAPPRKGNMPALNAVHMSLMYAAAAANVLRLIFGFMLAGATAENADPGVLTAYRVTSIAAPVLFATGFTLKLF